MTREQPRRAEPDSAGLEHIRIIEARLTELEVELTRLRAQWNGTATEAYQVAQEQWREALRDLSALLSPRPAEDRPPRPRRRAADTLSPDSPLLTPLGLSGARATHTEHMAMSREFWRAVETIHDVVYVAPGVTRRFAELGLTGFWMGYIASRAAALGTPPPELVIATFHGFAPDRIRRALPDAWQLADRDAIVALRLQIGREELAAAWPEAGLSDIAGRLHAMLGGLDWAGRPLAAAHAALPAPGDPPGRLWHAATVLREYRGDCHIAILTAAGLGGASANVLAQAAGLVPAEQQRSRGWDDAAWEKGREDLRQRGWLDAEGVITAAGRGAREQLESATDRVCAAGLDLEATAHGVAVENDLVALARRVTERGGFPDVNATGVPRPRP
ncbi:WXG100 family type VII secretion target [uncultured Aeromicrobium sp.]|uniref:WXG100 family type VII secretion target n=1 Tax=uncultured Aeromicrobium sp. TaxID=337820 RepID=UPI0025F74606|nr:WXG100 family type VII secretion target [uncultured Aeromicrobium sp.]